TAEAAAHEQGFRPGTVYDANEQALCKRTVSMCTTATIVGAGRPHAVLRRAGLSARLDTSRPAPVGRRHDRWAARATGPWQRVIRRQSAPSCPQYVGNRCRSK